MANKYKKGLYWDLLDQAEVAILCEYLEKNDGNLTHAAEELGLHRTHLQRKMLKFGLKENPNEGNAAWQSLSDDDEIQHNSGDL